ncbi:MAG: GNAT family N-acetyltransferase [Actinomycetes bacterium]
MPPDHPGELPARLVEHLRSWAGGWPPGNPPVLVGNPRNAAGGWDGTVHPVTGIVAPEGEAVVGVPPKAVARLDPTVGLDRLLHDVPLALDRPGHAVYRGTFRWSTRPADLPDAGRWVDADAQGVPEWLRPFGGQVLIALDAEGRYVAGVGVKRHDPAGHELAVVTEPAARGRGLARRLVAQAARRVLADGAVPTYLHSPDNTGSARVADAAGFPDLGWRVLGLFEKP